MIHTSSLKMKFLLTRIKEHPSTLQLPIVLQRILLRNLTTCMLKKEHIDPVLSNPPVHQPTREVNQNLANESSGVMIPKAIRRKYSV